MSLLTITTPFNIDLEFKLAPFHKRGLAMLTDIVFAYIIAYAITVWGIGNIAHLPGETAMVLLIVFGCIPVFLYPLLAEIFFNGETLGKKLFGLKVMDDEGHEPSISQYLIRFFLNFGNYAMGSVPVMLYQGGLRMSFTLGLLYIIISRGMVAIPALFFFAFTKKGQRMGDLAAGTVVIDKAQQVSINETIYLDIEQNNYQPVFPQVMRLSDRDINGIKNLLSMKPRSREVNLYVIDVAQRIKDLLAVQTDLHPYDFLQQLLTDYNAITMR